MMYVEVVGQNRNSLTILIIEYLEYCGDYKSKYYWAALTVVALALISQGSQGPLGPL